MMDIVNSIIQGKLNDIQSRIPIDINLVNNNDSFQNILNTILDEKSVNTYSGYDNANYTYNSNIENGVNDNQIKSDMTSYNLNNIKNINSEKNSIEQYINDAAIKYNIDPNLINSLIKAESAYDPYAKSSTGAMGLMQLMPSTASYLGIKDPFDPKENIDGGTRYLKDLIMQFGSIDKALAAYNAGPYAVIKYNGVPPYKETTDYVNKIINDLKK